MKALSFFANIHKINSLLIFTDADDSMSFYYATVRKNKDDYIIINESTFGNIDECIEAIDYKAPLIVTIEGKGVLHKNVTRETQDAIIQQFSSINNGDDFYIQHYVITEEKSIVSISRKEFVDQLLDKFYAKRRYPISLFLGPFSLNVLSDYLDTNINIGSEIIKFFEGKVYDITPCHKFIPSGYIKISDDNISVASIIPYSSAICFFTKYKIVNFISEIATLRNKDYIYENIFHIGKYILLIFSFIVLSINFFCYSIYDRELKNINAEMSSAVDSLTMINKLKKEINEKKTVMGTNNYLASTNFSMYSDRIASCMPEQISLDIMNMFPVNGKIQTNSDIKFSTNKIVIQGETDGLNYVDIWIKSLYNEKWIKNVHVDSYKYNVSTGLGLFQLTIETNEEQSIK